MQGCCYALTVQTCYQILYPPTLAVDEDQVSQFTRLGPEDPAGRLTLPVLGL